MTLLVDGWSLAVGGMVARHHTASERCCCNTVVMYFCYVRTSRMGTVLPSHYNAVGSCSSSTEQWCDG